MKNERTLRSLDVKRVTNSVGGGGTIFVRLPRSAWEVSGICHCDNCKGRIGFWDTMAIATKPPTGHRADVTWLVHMPEGHPFHDNVDYKAGTFFTSFVGLPDLAAKVLVYIEDSRSRGLDWEVENLRRAIDNAVPPMPHNPDVVPS